MAATVKKTMWPVASSGNVVPAPEIGFIAASQGILIPNAPLYLSSSGVWKAADTCDGTGDVYHGFLAGLVDRTLTWPLAAAQAANVKIWVARIRTDIQYHVFTENNATDSAAAQTIVGNDYGLTVSTGSGKVGYTTLDLNSTTNTAFHVDDIYSNWDDSGKFTTSTDPGRAIGHFLAANVDAQKA